MEPPDDGEPHPRSEMRKSPAELRTLLDVRDQGKGISDKLKGLNVHMQRGLTLAQSRKGLLPLPRVGSVVVDAGNNVVGEGTNQLNGQHAERAAVLSALEHYASLQYRSAVEGKAKNVVDALEFLKLS